MRQRISNPGSNLLTTVKKKLAQEKLILTTSNGAVLKTKHNYSCVINKKRNRNGYGCPSAFEIKPLGVKLKILKLKFNVIKINIF